MVDPHRLGGDDLLDGCEVDAVFDAGDDRTEDGRVDLGDAVGHAVDEVFVVAPVDDGGLPK